MPNNHPQMTEPAENTSPEAFIAWAKANAVPLATVEPNGDFVDLAPLTEVVGNAKVVAFGENGHDVHEFLAFRTRLFRFFVEHMGFTALAVESGYPASVLADRYVLGEDVPVREAAQGVFAWNPSPLAENLGLIDWMRQHNAGASTSRKIRIYGIDLPGGEASRFVHSRRAVDNALAYLQTVDAHRADSLGGQLEAFLDRFCDAEYYTLTPRERNDLTAAISDLVGSFERERLDLLAEAPAIRYWRAYHNAVAARQLDSLFRASPLGFQMGPQVPANSMSRSTQARDAAMARSLQWVLEREGPEGRVLLFAHNWHVKMARLLKTAWPEMFPEGPVPTMGEHLTSILADQMIVIGSAFGRGCEGTPATAAEPDSIDAALARVGVPTYALDLRAAPTDGCVGKWLDRGGRMRIGGDPADGRYCEIRVGDAFDALVYVDEVSAAHVIPRETHARRQGVRAPSN